MLTYKQYFEIDNAFSSMSFEPISLPEFAHGKVHEAIDELTEESQLWNNILLKWILN